MHPFTILWIVVGLTIWLVGMFFSFAFWEEGANEDALGVGATTTVIAMFWPFLIPIVSAAVVVGCAARYALFPFFTWASKKLQARHDRKKEATRRSR